jgi:hypothetical protein
MLYSEYLQPVIDRLPASTAVKKALESEDFLLLIYHHLFDLTKVFCKYAECKFNSNNIDDSRDSGMMNLQQFTQFSTDFDFLGFVVDVSYDDNASKSELTLSSTTADIGYNDSENGNDNDSQNDNDKDIRKQDDMTITLKDIRQVFSASQHDTAMNEAEIQLVEDDSHKETMVFPEFIEAIVRLGFLKYSPKSKSTSKSLSSAEHDKYHIECIRLAIKKVTGTNVLSK